MFGWTKMFMLVAVASMVAVVTGGAGATSTPTLAPATASHATAAGKASSAAARRGALLRTANLNTPAGAALYLRAIGLDPRGLVIQRGARNYAGPSCPGAGWACTSTAHPVIQIAAAGGNNTFLCTTGSCAVVQATMSGTATKTTRTRSLAAATATNKATCIKTTGLTQSCTINQTSASADNTAIVVENVPKASGLTQTASATARITQRATGATNSNTACVNQNINVDGSTKTTAKGAPVTVTLEAHQSVIVTQDAAHGGNTVQNATSAGCDPANPLTQMQTLTSTATGSGLVNQYENQSSSGPNVDLDIEQNQSSEFLGNSSVSGVNRAVFSQTNALTAIAVTPAGAVNQTQSSASGGIRAIVNQWSHDDAHPSTITATQIETQCEHAQFSSTPSPSCSLTSPMQPPTQYSPKQIQYGPVRKDAGSTQGDNPNDSFTINQSSTQNNDTHQAQDQSNNVQGACSTSGYCTVIQTTAVDGQPATTNIQSGQNVDTTTSCTGSTCTAPTPGITFDGSPGFAAPPSTLGPYTMTAFGADSQQPSCPDSGSTVTGVTDPAGTISFTPALRHDQVGGCWTTWSHGYTGDVYDTVSTGTPTTAMITLPSGTNAFYFYAEPNTFGLFNITATAQNGTTSGPIQVEGNSGAKYFGFYGTGGVTLASITVTTEVGASGFAVGEFGIQVAPAVIG